MLQDILLTPEEIALKAEVRAFVKREVSPDLIRKMDRDEITYPREFVKALGTKSTVAAAWHGARRLPPWRRWASSGPRSAAPSRCPRS
jgi:alkylation response protein AidB-like acyl-CoA dehydrogenase